MDFSPRLPTRSHAAAETACSVGCFAKVEVHHDPAAILEDWATLEALAPASAYQTRAFTMAWLETIGASRCIAPFFISARDAADRPAALLCLGIERHGPFRVATFLGRKEANFSFGLFAPHLCVTAADLSFLLHAAARAARSGAPDLYLLHNQPFDWGGIANPLALLPHQRSPSFAYATDLVSNGEKFLAAKLSKDSRKKLRKKEARLAELGPVAMVSNETPAVAAAILETFFAEKIARCEARAIAADFTDPAIRAFFERLNRTEDGCRPWFEFYALKAGERIVATYAGAAHQGRFSCLVNSFDLDPEIAKSSPGELLLTRLIAHHCDRGTKSFDLGIGEARYKQTYCDVTVPLFDIVLPLNAAGRFYGIIATLRLKAKRMIKQNPKIFAIAQTLRQRVPGLGML